MTEYLKTGHCGTSFVSMVVNSETMKHLILVFLIGFGYTSFSQETVIKEERKTKVEGNHFKEKIVKTEEVVPAKTVVKARAASHAAYQPVRVHHTYAHRAISHRTRHHASRAVAHRKHYHKKAAHRHYKEMKKKYHKGKTKIKYEY